ncbi:dTDP-4-dehydrorhamnose reductase [Acinetobacter brisouii CIP 110357]|uniref:dTDP-4-dehydrorhamnose reductase n=1 Tax=Acinetobacter brisouii CIP 110357 TaxID=1341683 RepID=V2UGH9_9GAMM|nr:dTDP-4-dehydrorhamnose reductase [Acinetobacter brisouii]ENV46919.1 dTDP-4-dehydrorhamnose reductase [Acinetobacter brisouii ANC 4119]ESK47671.1 dTDP-4-dehydrorhamnose reductase [Acinetobacter brisouii CIP 110357]ESK50221.1 dTDP-4-dehydrorhamnose reductase [Acinetobacter brisouii CIP 110357]
MKILLLGKNGQVGWELQRALQPLGEVIALDRHTNAQGLCGDIANLEAITQLIQQVQPDVVVNATAYTAVDKAESEPKQADLINHLAVKHLAEKCQAVNALLVHYSTDYVFSGQGTQTWQEQDVTAPQNVYGQSKRAGEVALEQSAVKFINFRTSWVYGTHGQNFIKTMLRLAQAKEELSIIADQIGAPTGAALIADVTAQAIRYYSLHAAEQQQQLCGHYHLAASGETSWYEYAQYIFDVARYKGLVLKLQQVHPIVTTAYPTPAKRPLNSRLNTQKLQQQFHLHLPYWQQGVEQVLGEIIV